jgi:hypothetical protein
MKLLLCSALLFAMLTACLSAPVNPDAILTAYSKINFSDGVNEDEMKLIAQRFLLVTTEEPCKSDAKIVGISSPHVKCGWADPNQKDGGCYIGFSKKGVFELVPLYVKVSDVTGKASCAGYLILK